MLSWESDAMKQILSQLGLCLSHSNPVSRSEISAKGLAYLKEEVPGQDIRVGPNDVWEVLDLAEAGLHIICMDHDVIVQRCDV